MATPYGNNDYLEHPFTGPLQRAVEMKGFLEDMAFKREQRQMMRDQYQNELQDRKRRNAVEDFNTLMSLHQMHALPVAPGIVGKMQAGMGGRGTIDTATQGQFSLPTDEQRFERQKTMATQKGTLTGMEKSAADEVTGGKEGKDYEEVDMGEFGLPGGKRQVTKGKGAELIANIVGKQHGKPVHPITNKTTGDVTFVDDQGNVVRTVKGIAGTAAASGAGAKLYPGEEDFVHKEFDKRIPGWYNQHGISAKDLSIYKGEKPSESAERSSIAHRVDSAQNELRKALQTEYRAKNAPVSGGGKAAAATAGASAAGAQKDPVPASKLSSLLNSPATKARGIKDMNALRKDLMKFGYEIDEAN